MFSIVQSLLFIGVGAGAGEKKYPEPVKNGPAPQHGLPGLIQTLLGGVTLKIWLIPSKCFYLQEEEACTVYSVLYLYANEKSDPDPNRNVSEPAKPEHN